MIRKIILLASLQCTLTTMAPCQTAAPESILPYLHGISSGGALLLDIRGYEIIVQKTAGDFSKPYFARMFPGFNLHRGYKALPDSSLGVQAYRIASEKMPGPDSVYSGYLFIRSTPDTILGITIAGPRPPDKALEQALIGLTFQNAIPDSLISTLRPPIKLRFAGRTIAVDDRCRWRASSAIQCSGFGEMNWSIHPDITEAAAFTQGRQDRNARGKQFIIQQETDVPVLFEGADIIARKVQYQVKGIAGLLTKAEGSRTLIVYYITAPVRGRFVSCVLSHWTSDYIAEDGLPPLLGTVMRLK